MSDRSKLFVVAAGAGAVGGMLSWLYPLVATQSPVVVEFVPIAGAILFGCVAGLIGIFLANTDTADLYRCFVYALVCGMFWKPVIDGAQNLVKEAERERPTLQARKLAPDVAAAAENLQKAPSPASVNLATRDGVKLAALLPQIQDPAVKAEAERAVQQLVTAVGDAGAKDPGTLAAAVESLNSVAATATDTKQPKLAMESHLKAAAAAAEAPPESVLAPHQVETLKQNADAAVKYFRSIGDEAKASVTEQQIGKLKARSDRSK